MTGQELRKVRTGLKLTQKDLAARIGVTSTSVARWERDEVGISEPVARLVRMLTQPHPPRRREK
jgi:transcriptional regulator with XRE-family HTH domain